MSGRRYWLGLGPITSNERDRAFKYLEKKGLPRDRNSRAFKNYIARMRKRREVNRYLKSKTKASAQVSAPWQILYGDVRTGGLVSLAHMSGPAADPHRYAHIIITVAAHEINRIVAVYFDDYQVEWDTDLSTRPTGVINAGGIFTGLVQMQINYGSDGQNALSYPLSLTGGENPVSGKWTSDHRQRGHAHVYFRLQYNENVFKNGIPDIDFRILGNQNVIDPRTSSASPAASNAAMVLYDYMTNSRYGLGLSTSLFDSTTWNQACNDCEDSIALAGGGNQLRYLINAIITSDEAPGAVIDEMLASMAGRMNYCGGKFHLYVGKGRTSEGHVMQITEDQILSDIQVLTKTPRVDSFNTIRGTFISEVNSHEESDFPVVTNSTYKTEDNNKEVIEDVTYSMVTDGVRCQRLAKIELEASRQGIYVEFTAALSCYQIMPGEWVGITFSNFGWSSKTFEIIRSELLVDESDQGTPSHVVKLTAKETSSAIYDWNTGNETTYDVAPNTNLPDPYTVVAPSAPTLASGTEHLYIRSDGTVFSRLYVQWTQPADTFVINGGYYEIQFKRTAESSWIDATDVPGSSTNSYILDVEDSVSYDVRIRSVNAIGARSSWATTTGHTVVGKTEPPSNVATLSASVSSAGVRLTWPGVSDLDVREYEIRWGASGITWASAIGNGATRVRATSFTYPTFRSGDWVFMVRAVDTTGNYSALEATILLSVPAPSAVRNLISEQIDSTIVLNWEEPASSLFPISHYEIQRQETITSTNTAEVRRLGTVDSTFATFNEIISGTYTYIITPVDVAGNRGLTAQTTLVVYPPRDFVLRDSDNLDLSTAVLLNASYIPGSITVDTVADSTETWEQHFVDNGFTTIQGFIDAGFTYWLEPLAGATGTVSVTIPDGVIWMPFNDGTSWEEHYTQNSFENVQDFIDAGYDYWLQPNTGNATTWQEFFLAFGADNMQELYDAGGTTLSATTGLPVGVVTIDYDIGETLAQSVIAFDYQLVGSGLRPTPRIGWRSETGGWVWGQPGRTKVTANDFRYLRVMFTAEAATATDWCAIGDVSYEIQVREIVDGGTVAVLGADSGGTTVLFNRAFLDVSSLVVSAQGSTELKAVRDFTDAPNPTSFKVLLFDADGNRVDGTVSWSARGVQAVI